MYSFFAIQFTSSPEQEDGSEKLKVHKYDRFLLAQTRVPSNAYYAMPLDSTTSEHEIHSC